MITQPELKALLHYCQDTGEFRWLNSLDSIAGCIKVQHNGKRYRQIKINYTSYLAHRLAFLYMTGSFPVNQGDHADGNGLNNIWSNLSDITVSENNKNLGLASNNKSGFTGVNWHKQNSKWKVQIGVDKKRIFLGYFTELDDAIEARKEANVKYDFHKNHGDKRH